MKAAVSFRSSSSAIQRQRHRTEAAMRETLERFGREHFGVKELDDWYAVEGGTVRKELSFLKNFRSLYDALKKFYPQHDWDPLRFTRVPQGYWTDVNTQRAALERFGREKLGIKELDDWYSVSAVDVHKELTFLSKKYGSLFDVLKRFYPQHNWDPLRLSRVPNGYWTDENSQRAALERFGREKLGIKELDDWYSVSALNVHQELSFLSKKYRSLYEALEKLYPQHNWDPLRFTRAPYGYWQQPIIVQEYHNMFMNWKQTHTIRTVADLYQLSPQQVNLFKRAAKGIFGSQRKMLEEWFPDIVWQSQFTSQLQLKSLLQNLVANVNVRHHIPGGHYLNEYNCDQKHQLRETAVL